jgi:hypothetical protein
MLTWHLAARPSPATGLPEHCPAHLHATVPLRLMPPSTALMQTNWAAFWRWMSHKHLTANNMMAQARSSSHGNNASNIQSIPK